MKSGKWKVESGKCESRTTGTVESKKWSRPRASGSPSGRKAESGVVSTLPEGPKGRNPIVEGNALENGEQTTLGVLKGRNNGRAEENAAVAILGGSRPKTDPGSRREPLRLLRAVRIGNPSRLVLIPYRYAGERRE
jgi:hypothetical protein